MSYLFHGEYDGSYSMLLLSSEDRIPVAEALAVIDEIQSFWR